MTHIFSTLYFVQEADPDISYSSYVGVLCTKMLETDPLSPLSCKAGLHGPNLFVQHITQTLNWTEIFGIWRPSHLKLTVTKPFLRHFCFVGEKMILLKEATVIREVTDGLIKVVFHLDQFSAKFGNYITSCLFNRMTTCV